MSSKVAQLFQLQSNPVDLGFVDSYWYWRIRAETAILDPENLPKKSSDDGPWHGYFGPGTTQTVKIVR